MLLGALNNIIVWCGGDPYASTAGVDMLFVTTLINAGFALAWNNVPLYL